VERSNLEAYAGFGGGVSSNGIEDVRRLHQSLSGLVVRSLSALEAIGLGLDLIALKSLPGEAVDGGEDRVN
jgi:hypothetical protein